MALCQQGMAAAPSSPERRASDNLLCTIRFSKTKRANLDDIEISKTVSAERTIHSRVSTWFTRAKQLNKDVFNFYVRCYVADSLLEIERLSVFCVYRYL